MKPRTTRAALLALCLSACATSVPPPSREPQVTLCVLDASDVVARALRGAVALWQVDWGVESATASEWAAAPEMCVPVYAVGDTSTWPAEQVAQTLFDAETRRPVAIELGWVWWETCPRARWATLLHEVGHAAGHRHHTHAGVMAREVACTPPEGLTPTDSEVETARRERGRWVW